MGETATAPLEVLGGACAWRGAELEASVRGPVRGAVYSTCIGRGINLFGDDSEELRMIQRLLVSGR